MVNLFDIMRSAQSGEAITNLSRQYGLSAMQTQRAVEALLPAFTLGFQRTLYDPQAFGSFLKLMSSGQYAPFYDFSSPNGTAEAVKYGNEVLTQLLGSKEVGRQVAEQAASATGIGAQVLQQMLPAIAATLMGGLFRYTTLQGLGDVFADWSRAFHRAHEMQAARKASPLPPSSSTTSRPVTNPFDAWNVMISSMLKPGASPAAATEPVPPPRKAATEPKPAAFNPFEAWADMMTAMFGTKKPEPEPPSSPPPPPPPSSAPHANALVTLTQMFETGREVQSQYLASLQSVMNGFWSAARKQGEPTGA